MKALKRVLAVMLAAMLALSMVACGDEKGGSTSDETNNNTSNENSDNSGEAKELKFEVVSKGFQFTKDFRMKSRRSSLTTM